MSDIAPIHQMPAMTRRDRILSYYKHGEKKYVIDKDVQWLTDCEETAALMLHHNLDRVLVRNMLLQKGIVNNMKSAYEMIEDAMYFHAIEQKLDLNFERIWMTTKLRAALQKIDDSKEFDGKAYAALAKEYIKLTGIDKEAKETTGEYDRVNLYISPDPKVLGLTYTSADKERLMIILKPYVKDKKKLGELVNYEIIESDGK